MTFVYRNYVAHLPERAPPRLAFGGRPLVAVQARPALATSSDVVAVKSVLPHQALHLTLQAGDNVLVGCLVLLRADSIADDLAVLRGVEGGDEHVQVALHDDAASAVHLQFLCGQWWGGGVRLRRQVKAEEGGGHLHYLRDSELCLAPPVQEKVLGGEGHGDGLALVA